VPVGIQSFARKMQITYPGSPTVGGKASPLTMNNLTVGWCLGKIKQDGVFQRLWREGSTYHSKGVCVVN